MNTTSPVLLAHNLCKRVQGPEGGLDLLQGITLEV
ncbi:ABC transporter, partial [Flagellimonas olearia]